MRSLLLLAPAIALLAGSLPSSAAGLSAGGYHVLRIDAGLVKGLGDGTYGQLGTNPAGTPATVAGLTGITDVAAGGFSSLVLKSDGTVWFLGESTLQHTTPHGTPMPAATPVQVAGLSGIDAIAAGHRHYLALDTDTGDLYAWGHNGSGQLGDGGLLDVTTPALVLTNVATMAAGDGFSLAVKNDDTLWTWGRNTFGQLGLGDTTDRHVPTQVPGVTTADAVAAGGHHTLVLLNNTSLLAMGHNAFGQLGLGNTTSASSPTAVPGLTGVAHIAAGYHHSATLDTSDIVKTWGRNFEGQCGGGSSSPVNHSSPQTLTGLPATPDALACGYHFTVVALADGSLAGTGSNADGQLDGVSVADQDSSQKILTPQLIPLSPDLTPPTPSPMSFASPPTAFDATTIRMTATVATDLSEPVEYFFDCSTPGGHDSGWQTGTTYTDTGLVTGTSYTYEVRARDAARNETAPSPPASALAMADTTAPAPDPMTFAVAPTALGAGSITMTASTATDPNGAEYFFDCLTAGGHDSGWQDSPTYLDTGLAPATDYTYRVRARDKSAAQNPTGYSDPAVATTGAFQVILETDFTGRTVNGKTASNIPWTVGGILVPGDLTWALEGGGPTNTGLFDTANAQGHFAPDMNIGNEGPWSVTIPLTLTSPQLQLDDVELDWQHFNNSGNDQTANRAADWTVSVTGATSGLVGSVTNTNVSGISGVTTLVFNPPLTLSDSETYDLKISVTGSNGDGNNTGLDAITVNGSATAPNPSTSLLAHYTFDTESGGITPDEVGTAFATLGNRVQITTTGGLPKVGAGTLEMLGNGQTTGPADGAVTSNSFAWPSDARTATFWWQAATPNVDANDGTFVSFGSNAADGTRFDIKEQGASNTKLRVEVQGHGYNTNPAIDDGAWHFIAVVVPDNATFADIGIFVDGITTNLNGSTNTTAIITGTGPVSFGDSILTIGSDDRVPNGFLDDFQLYGEALDQSQIAFLYNNPGSTIGGSSGDFDAWIENPAYGLDPAERGFDDDPDGDQLANGLEAWFGSHPGNFSAGIGNLGTSGLVTTFSHPRNEDPPSDLGANYEWSLDLANWFAGDGMDGPPGGPTVTISATPSGTTANVTTTASESLAEFFVRIRVTQASE